MNINKYKSVLTLIVIFGGDGENGVLDVFILVHFRLVEGLVKVRRVVIFISDAYADELGHWKRKSTFQARELESSVGELRDTHIESHCTCMIRFDTSITQDMLELLIAKSKIKSHSISVSDN